MKPTNFEPQPTHFPSLIGAGLCEPGLNHQIDLRFPCFWKLFSFILGEKTRTRVFEPAHEDMLEQYYRAKRTYRTKPARLWLAIAFTVRTIVMVLECLRASAIDRAFGWVQNVWGKWR